MYINDMIKHVGAYNDHIISRTTDFNIRMVEKGYHIDHQGKRYAIIKTFHQEAIQ